MTYEIPKRKKLKMDENGILVYPHKFAVGQMITWSKSWKQLKKEIGLGIVTEITGNSMTIFWQHTGKYMKYNPGTANLMFEILV